jgi:hypothetical protein
MSCTETGKIFHLHFRAKNFKIKRFPPYSNHQYFQRRIARVFTVTIWEISVCLLRKNFSPFEPYCFRVYFCQSIESLALIDLLFTVVFPNGAVSVFTVTMQQFSACLLRKNVSRLGKICFAAYFFRRMESFALWDSHFVFIFSKKNCERFHGVNAAKLGVSVEKKCFAIRTFCFRVYFSRKTISCAF